MVLGNMDVGLNTQNLVGDSARDLAVGREHLRREDGRDRCRTSSPSPRSPRCWGWSLLGFAVGRNAQAIAANFGATLLAQCRAGRAASGAGRSRRTDRHGRTLTVLAVAQVGSLFSSDAWNNVTFTAGEVKNPNRNLPLSLALGTGVVIALYIAVQLRLPERAAAAWRRRTAATILGAGHPVCHRRPRGHGGHARRCSAAWADS